MRVVLAIGWLGTACSPAVETLEVEVPAVVLVDSPVRVSAVAPFDPSWAWVRADGGLVAINGEGTPVTWPDGSTGVDADLVDLLRGRFLRRREGRIEELVASQVTVLAEASAGWALDHDGTLWFEVDEHTEGRTLDGRSLSGPPIPAGMVLSGATRGTLCFSSGGYTVEFVCHGADGEQRYRHGSGAAPNIGGEFINGLVHFDINRQATYQSRLVDPVDGTQVWSFEESSPGRVLVGNKTSAWGHAYGFNTSVRGRWSADLDGAMFPIAISEDGRHMVASTMGKEKELVHITATGRTKLPFAGATRVRVVGAAPDTAALSALDWPGPWPGPTPPAPAPRP